MASNAVSIFLSHDGMEILVKAPFRYLSICQELARKTDDGQWSSAKRAFVFSAIPGYARMIIDAFAACSRDVSREVIALAGDNPAQADPRRLDLDTTPPPIYVTKPWEHQCIGYNLIATQPGTMLAYDMGTGKSKCVVDAVINLKPGTVLIMCPKSVIDVWPGQFDTHAAGHDVRVVCLENGSIAKRAKEMRIAVESRGDRQCVIVINYEAVWRGAFAQAVVAWRWGLAVCDESHRIKAPWGKISLFIGGLRKVSDRRICLTGTPLPHDPLDAFGQYRFLDPSIFGYSWVKFRFRYAVLGGYEGKEVVGYKNSAELNRKFYSVAHRVTKQEVLKDLPEFIHERHKVTLGKEASSIYNTLENDLKVQLRSGDVTVKNGLTKLLRLQQVTSGFIGTDEDTQERVGTEKISELEELCMSIAKEEPIVVFVRFRHDIAMIEQSNTGREVMKLCGGCNQLAEWQQSTGGEILVVQIQAGGVGVDLTRACYCVYYSVGFSLVDYEQSLARVHRPGQRRSVTYVHLIASGTVDEKVYAALKARKEVVEYVLSQIKDGGTRNERKSEPRRGPEFRWSEDAAAGIRGVDEEEEGSRAVSSSRQGDAHDA